MKLIIIKIVKGIANFCLTWLYNFVDDDKDGKVTKKEIEKTLIKLKEYFK